MRVDRHGISPRAWRRMMVAAASLLLASACAEGTQEDDGGGTYGRTLGADGTLWCAVVAGAYGYDGENDVEIIDGSEYPEYCECLGPELHGHLDTIQNLDPMDWDLDSNSEDDIDINEINPTKFVQLGDKVDLSFPAEVLDTRDLLIAHAGTDCDLMRLGLVLDPPTENPSCDDVADFEDAGDDYPDVLAIFEKNTGGEHCEVTDMIVVDTDGWSGTYTLANVITYSATKDTYFIDADFVDDMMNHPQWLLEDGTSIQPVGGGGYMIRDVGSGDIAEALGLQRDDIFVSINSMDLDDMDDVVEALGEHRNTTELTLVVERNSTNITLQYEIQ